MNQQTYRNLFNGLLCYLTPPYCNWSPQDFIKNVKFASVPEQFDLNPQLPANLGNKDSGDRIFLWGAMLMLARTIENTDKASSLTCTIRVDLIPAGWVSFCHECITGMAPISGLAFYPHLVSRLVAHVLVNDCGYKRTWTFDPQSTLLWVSITHFLIQYAKMENNFKFNPLHIQRIQDVISQFGFSRSWLVLFHEGIENSSALGELFRLAWSLFLRGTVPTLPDDSEHSEFMEFWKRHMHETIPPDLFQIANMNMEDLPLYCCTEENAMATNFANMRLSKSI